MKTWLDKWLLVLLLLIVGAPAQAAVNVVATTASMGMLARSVGGDGVRVTVLAPPDRDAHYLQARPSMMLALRRADLLLAVGADLEVAWLPAALRGAGNPRILPGQAGYLEAAAQVPLLDRGGVADRSRGDVHPMGNPHIYLDPQRMATVAQALAQRLGRLDPANVARYQANAKAFAGQVAARLPQWRERARGAKGVLLYHKDGNYLMSLLGVPILGYVEPIPGIPPSAQYLSELVQRLKGQQGVILYAVFQPSQGPQFLAGQLGWKAFRLPLEPAVDADSAGYFALIDQWVNAVAQAR
ncbi:MAG: metal ABC transporter substrate-binding protein [Pseudomonadota bacterium]|uniref:metal ABC transporter substrate-binding protein n=1 Tax=Thermithiobacillus tepidarius TaxID=929 RepID=UPI00040DB621|nr:metal ABC transporter substrate-binding protein [Thermithiobacillus tepidarius]